MLRRSMLPILFCLLLSVLGPGRVTADQIYFDVTFDDQPLDQPLGTGGTAAGQVSWANPDILLTVRSSPYPTPCLEVHNNDPAGPSNCGLEVSGGPVTSGLVVVDLDVWTQQTGIGWEWSFNLTTSGWATLAQISLSAVGVLGVGDQSGAAGTFGLIPLDRPVPIRFAFSLDEEVYSLWIDGVERITDRPLTNAVLDFSRIIVGTGWNSPPENVFWIDRIRVKDTLEEVPVARTTWGGVKRLYRS